MLNAEMKVTGKKLTITIDLEQEHGLADDLAHVVHLHHRFRHAREGGELIHHAPDVGDLADNRVGALLEDITILGDDFAVFAADAFGRQLDRCERVLDLVCDPAGNVGPGGGALCDH